MPPGGARAADMLDRVWFSANDLQGLPGIPQRREHIRRRAHRSDWPSRPHPRRRNALQFHASILPAVTQEALKQRLLAEAADVAEAHAFWARVEGAQPAGLAPMPVDYLTVPAQAFEIAPPFPTQHGTSPPKEPAVRSLEPGARRGPKPFEARDPEAWAKLKEIVGARPHARAKQVAEMMEVALGRSFCVRTIQRAVQKFRSEPVYHAAKSPDQWRSRRMPAFGDQAGQITRPNQQWQADASPSDVMLEGGRHSIIGTVDIWTRRVRFLAVPTSSGERVGVAWRRCLLEWGVPDSIKIDNGLDFTSRHVRRVLDGLEIEAVVSAPFRPDQKGFVERIFRTLSHDLVELLPGYVGHNVGDRQELRSRQSFADRLMKRKAGPVEIPMTQAAFQAFLDDWATARYGMAVHRGIGTAPELKILEYRGEIRRVADEHALDLLLAPVAGRDGIRTVQKHGIEVDRRIYISTALGLHVGRKVLLRRDWYVDLLHVFDAQSGAFIDHAHPIDTMASDEQRRIAIAARRLAHDTVAGERRKILADGRKSGVHELPEAIIAKAVARRDQIARLPNKHRIHTTPGLEQAEAALQGRPPAPLPSAQSMAAAAYLAAEPARRPAPSRPRPVSQGDLDRERARRIELQGEHASPEDKAWYAKETSTESGRMRLRVIDAIDEDQSPKKKAAS